MFFPTFFLFCSNRSLYNYQARPPIYRLPCSSQQSSEILSFPPFTFTSLTFVN